jgi:hypothetical protein
MTDQTGAAPAAAEPSLVPINEAPATQTNPVDSAGPEKEPEPAVEQPKPSASVKEAIEKADAKLKEAPKAETKPVEGKPEAKIEAKPESKPRDETGKFAAKTPQDSQPAAPVEQKVAAAVKQPADPTSYAEAPRGYSEAAKSEWANTPEAVRADIHRRQGELEKGINQYRDFVEPLKPYVQLAQQHNTTIDKALNQYITLERSLRSSDPAQKTAALNDVFQAAGVNPRDWAAQILNQSPDQVASQQDATIQELRQQISRLEQQVGGVTQTFQQQREQETLQTVTKFAEDNPRFEELADDIAFFMKTGRANNLSEAYELAERLNPAPAQANAPTPVIPATPPADAHTKGTKSISGAPSPGSSPAAKKGPSPSIRKALESAMARAS